MFRIICLEPLMDAHCHCAVLVAACVTFTPIVFDFRSTIFRENVTIGTKRRLHKGTAFCIAHEHKPRVFMIGQACWQTTGSSLREARSPLDSKYLRGACAWRDSRLIEPLTSYNIPLSQQECANGYPGKIHYKECDLFYATQCNAIKKYTWRRGGGG